ncbi:MAG TPA: restriction endonuclease [bacterium]|nr:restriction endonuclease [bacterium]
MNYWTDLSIQFANQRNYLDELFKIYPTIPDEIREVDEVKWKIAEEAFNNKDNAKLLDTLLDLPLFPIKDSYVAYLKRDQSAIERNPETVSRLCSRLYQMGLTKIFERVSEPKETNRQIGPLFRRWLQKGELGLPLLDLEEFTKSKDNAILNSADAGLMLFAREHLGYQGTKGLDLVIRMHNKYVIGEAKFLTDFGGHQNAQFEDAKNLLKDKTARAIKIGVLDGVLYIKGKNKMFKYITENKEEYTMLSSLLLREFLYQL